MSAYLTKSEFLAGMRAVNGKLIIQLEWPNRGVRHDFKSRTL